MMHLSLVLPPSWQRRILLPAIALFVHALPATAQVPDERAARATRAELEAMQAEAERTGDTARAAQIAARLRTGDIHPGDRLIVEVRAAQTRVDTLTVRSDRSVEIPDVGAVALAGVLRSELGERLHAGVAAYLRNATVVALPLLRIAVMGEVVRPGFYAFTSNTLLTDVFMIAGGPTPQADLARVEIRREGRTLADAQASRRMLDGGYTVEEAELRPGDEIRVGRRREMSQTTVISWITAIGTLIALTTALAR